MTIRFSGAWAAFILVTATTTLAQAHNIQEVPRHTRVVLGPQLVPSYPGADRFNVRPFVPLMTVAAAKPHLD